MNTILRAALDQHYASLAAAPMPSDGGAPVHCPPQQFRAAMALLPTGVSLLTCRHPDGIWAMTIGSLTSLSLQPPLLLVCLHRASRTLDLIAEHGRFAVNILAAHHARLADTFARPRDHTACQAVPFTTVDELPAVPDALAVLTCQHEHTYTSGDHAIVIGAVRHTQHHPGGEPLVRHNSRYRKLR